jgi:hypothetical protein
MHYINGKVETLDEVKARATPRDRILVTNMEGNGWKRIVTTSTRWSWCQPLASGDKVLNGDGRVIHEEP